MNGAKPIVVPEQPQGALTIRVRRDDGRVVVMFDQSIRWLAMTPAQALALARDLEARAMLVGG